jgi:hypothetical protein
LRFTAEQVLAVLELATYPMTTSEVLEACREAADQPRFGGKADEVRPALDELVAAGIAVTARERNSARNMYQYIARPSDGRTSWWMTKARADDFALELSRRMEALAEAKEQAMDLMALLRGSRVKVELWERDGKITFELEGNQSHMTKLITVLEKAEEARDAL